MSGEMDAGTYRLEVDAKRLFGQLRREYPQADSVVTLPQALLTRKIEKTINKQ